MRLKNTTDFDPELIREVIRFTVPPGVSGFDVRVCNSTAPICVGMAYSKGSSYHDRACPFVVCRVGHGPFPAMLEPYQYGQLKGKKYVIRDRVEALIYIMAHELRHLWQGKAKNKRGYYPGARGRFSEIDTESYAINRLRAWRNRNSKGERKMEITVDDVKGVLKKMKVEFTAGITKDRAEAKLARAIQDRNVPIPWPELNKREFEILAEMGFEPKEKIQPKEDSPAQKTEAKSEMGKAHQDIPDQKPIPVSVPETSQATAQVQTDKKPKAPRAPTKRKGEGAWNKLKSLFDTPGKTFTRQEVLDKHKEWNVDVWTVMNYISLAKKDATLLGFKLQEEKTAEGQKKISRVG